MAQWRLIGGEGGESWKCEYLVLSKQACGGDCYDFTAVEWKTEGHCRRGGGAEQIAAKAVIIMSVQPGTKAEQVAGRRLQRAKDTARRQKWSGGGGDWRARHRQSNEEGKAIKAKPLMWAGWIFLANGFKNTQKKSASNDVQIRV